MNRFQITAVVCILSQLPFLCPAASIPPGNARRVGLLRLNEAADPEHPASTRLLESRLRQWLENDPSLSLEVTPLDASLSQDQQERDRQRARLRELNARLAAEAVANETPVSRAEFDALVSSVDKTGEGGLVLQSALLTTALLDRKEGRDVEMATALRAAAVLNPLGQLRDAIPWEWESAAELGPFLDSVHQAEKSEVRSCSVSLQVQPASSQLFVNGFAIGTRRQIDLVPGQRYVVRASAAGFDSAAQATTCSHSGKQIARLSLNKRANAALPDSAELRRLTEANGVGSLVLIRSERDRYRLFLYTPGAAVDELPLRRPLTVQDLNRTDSLPISVEGFHELMGKQRLAPTELALGSETSAIPGATPDWTGRTSESMESTSRWYNSPVFWVVVGAVAAGAAIALVATHDAGTRTQGGVSYSIK